MKLSLSFSTPNLKSHLRHSEQLLWEVPLLAAHQKHQQDFLKNENGQAPRTTGSQAERLCFETSTNDAEAQPAWEITFSA